MDHVAVAAATGKRIEHGGEPVRSRVELPARVSELTRLAPQGQGIERAALSGRLDRSGAAGVRRCIPADAASLRPVSGRDT